MLPTKKQTFIILSLVFLFFEVNAHGFLSARIKEKTMEIYENPRNAILYFERGYLYHQHNEYKKAIKDYKKSEHLGLKSKILYYRKSESYCKVNKLKKALNFSEVCLKFDTLDVKVHKQKAQILFQLKKYNEAVKAYRFVIENTQDLRPEDYIAYSDIILAFDNNNYKRAIAAIDLGLNDSDNRPITFQLKKLELLKKSNQTNKVIEQYNAIILLHERKEFWYYKKAKYLLKIEDYKNANIAIQQAKLAINELKLKYKNTSALKNLQNDINNLELKLKS